MDEYINRLNMYLPIDFTDDKCNEYRQYLVESYSENCENGKHQFALMAFHMMFMSFLYKEFWGIKTFSLESIQSLIEHDNGFKGIVQATNKMFDLSKADEKVIIDKYLVGVLGMHSNDKDDVQGFVNKRDHCAHASGFVQYRQKNVERYCQDVLEYAQKISSTNKSSIVSIFFKHLENFLTDQDEFDSKSTGEFIFDKIRELKFSYIDITYVLKDQMPRYITDDESCILKVAYYFSMIQLHSEYLEYISASSLPNGLGIDDSYFVNKLFLLLETISGDKRAILQVQIEDELEYLAANGCVINLDKITGITDSQ